jgi:hypothetical protein
MSKRKPATASKRARSTKVAAQRAKHAVVRSPKESPLRSNAAGSTKSSPQRRSASKQEAQQGFVFPSATANVGAYQATLLEMAQANMQLAFEFAQRLTTIRSPVEILGVIAEFTSRRIAMFQNYSIEMAEVGIKR